ncbi:MAG: sensor histidine kinase [Bacteroidota bacterium]
MQKPINIFIFLLFSGFSLLFVSCNDSNQVEYPLAKKGILDLRNWDFDKNGNIKLNGQWEFYWKNLYTPDDFEKKLTVEPEYIKTPKIWTNKGPNLKSYSLTGYATYRLKILIKDNNQLFNLYSKIAMYSSSQIFVNGVNIGGNGKVSEKKEKSISSYNLLSEPFRINSDELEIIIMVSNYEKNRPGGFIFGLELGKVHNIAALEKRNLIINLLIIGGIFIVMVYHFALFMMRPYSKSTLYFALFNLFLLSYFSSMYGMPYFVSNYQLIRILRTFGWIMAVPAFILLLKSIFPKEINKRVPPIIIFISIIAFSAFLLKIEYTLDLYRGFTIIAGLYIILIAAMAFIRKRENANFFLFGISFVAFSAINDSLLHSGLIESVSLTQYGLFLFLLIQSYILSSRFSIAYKKNEKMSYELAYINKNLEKLVIERTSKIEDQNIQLEKLNATKDRFFSIIAHDLRGPVGNLATSLGLITENFENLKEKNKLDLLKALKSSSDKTYHLLENLLIWSKVQRNSILYKPGNILLHELIAENIDLVKPEVQQKQIKITTQIPKNLKIYADSYMMDTIVRNLLGNAIKFTDENGNINIIAKSLKDRTIITISDTGIGIKQENVNKLFRIEHNYFALGTNGERGSGLGLILCKEFIDKHKGEIHVESIQGKGSIFKLSLPSIKTT